MPLALTLCVLAEGAQGAPPLPEGSEATKELPRPAVLTGPPGRRLRIIMEDEEPPARVERPAQGAIDSAPLPPLSPAPVSPPPPWARTRTEPAVVPAQGSREPTVEPWPPVNSDAPDDAEPPAWANVPAREPWEPDDWGVSPPPFEGWRIQVGAFRDPGRAQAWLATVEPVAAGPGARPVGVLTPAPGSSPPLYRAQLTGFVDSVAAEDACYRVRMWGGECFIVAPARRR